MSRTPTRIGAVLAALALPALAVGCAQSQVEAGESSGTTAAPSPSPTPSSTPTTLAIPAQAAGEFGRVSLSTKASRTVGSAPMVSGEVYRLVAACLRGGDDGRVVVDLRNTARGADRAKSVTTFSIACDGDQHDVDFQVAVPTRPALYLTGTTADTVGYATVVGTGRKATCGCT